MNEVQLVTLVAKVIPAHQVHLAQMVPEARRVVVDHLAPRVTLVKLVFLVIKASLALRVPLAHRVRKAHKDQTATMANPAAMVPMVMMDRRVTMVALGQ